MPNVSLEERREKLKRLDELCLLLSKQDAPVMDWFTAMEESKNNVDSFTNIAFLDQEEKDNLNMTVGFIPQLFAILHECILNLRWKEVLRVMNSVLHTCRGSSHTIWKVGNELVQREKSERLVRKLYEQTKHLTDLGVKEVVLEFVFYLMSSGRHESALANLQEGVPGLKNFARFRTEKSFYVNRLTRAYTGLLYYLEWKALQKRLEQSQQEASNPKPGVPLLLPSSFQPQQLEMRMNNFANKAILCFQELDGQPGIWDIFVTIHIELLVYQENKEGALTVLQKYADLNSHNPNPHRYLCRFYREHFPESENVLKQLKVVAGRNPSDSLVLELCEELKNDDLGLACSYLFSLLDYASWQSVLTPWNMLSQYLKSVFTARCDNKAARKQVRKCWKATVKKESTNWFSWCDNKAARKQVRKCWKARSSWWPVYHFSPYHLKAGGGQEKPLIYHKALVAGFLIGPDNKFTAKSKKVMDIEEHKKLKKILEMT